MLSMLKKIGSIAGFLIVMLESAIELLGFLYEETDLGREDLKKNLILLILAIYDAVDELTEQDIPVPRELVEKILNAIFSVIYEIAKAIRVFR